MTADRERTSLDAYILADVKKLDNTESRLSRSDPSKQARFSILKVSALHAYTGFTMRITKYLAAPKLNCNTKERKVMMLYLFLLYVEDR